MNLLCQRNRYTMDSLFDWIEAMRQINYDLRVAASADLPLYISGFRCLSKVFHFNKESVMAATYTKERFAIIESELHTMLSNRKIDPDNIIVNFHLLYQLLLAIPLPPLPSATDRSVWCPTRRVVQRRIISSLHAHGASWPRTPASFVRGWRACQAVFSESTLLLFWHSGKALGQKSAGESQFCWTLLAYSCGHGCFTPGGSLVAYRRKTLVCRLNAKMFCPLCPPRCAGCWWLAPPWTHCWSFWETAQPHSNTLQKDKQCKQRHSFKLGKERRESSKRNYYIISPRVIIKAIIIILYDI